MKYKSRLKMEFENIEQRDNQIKKLKKENVLIDPKNPLVIWVKI